MSRIDLRSDESLEHALRRFKRKIEREGILRQVKERKHYEKPSERKRRKIKNASADRKMERFY